MADQSINEIIEQTKIASEDWAQTPLLTRQAYNLAIADQLDLYRSRLANLMVEEVGKPVTEAQAEVDAAIKFFRLFGSPFAFGDPACNRHVDGFGGSQYMERHPHGVVGLITPWNYPVSNPAQKIAPALACGNTVIWRPTPATPRISKMMSQVIDDAGLPKSVFATVIESSDVLARKIVADDRVKAISFTGSTKIGEQIYIGASSLLKPVQCEMGGKNAAVILKDADLDLAASQVANGAFGFAGQKCTAISRVFVEHEVALDFRKALLAKIAECPFGDPRQTRTRIGPLISAVKKNQLCDEIVQAEKRGLVPVRPEHQEVIGDISGDKFLEPVVFFDVPLEDPIMQKELFGPILAVAGIADLQGAIDAVNEGRYGLAACIFTSNIAAATTFERKAQAGIVKINQMTPGLSPYVPASGWKQSGAGLGELSSESIRFYSKPKSIYR